MRPKSFKIKRWKKIFVYSRGWVIDPGRAFSERVVVVAEVAVAVAVAAVADDEDDDRLDLSRWSNFHYNQDVVDSFERNLDCRAHKLGSLHRERNFHSHAAPFHNQKYIIPAWLKELTMACQLTEEE